MSETQEMTFADVKSHNNKKTARLVSGGEEVLVDVGGQDATEAFEDVGHSDEARTILDGLLKGTLKRVEGDPEPTSKTSDQPDWSSQYPAKDGTGMGVMFYALVLLGGGLAFGAYKYLQAKSAGEAGK
ncbi:MAG: hypothetical protein Q9220_000536 [cf. Caloplaca sp. 1 TL-2023]